MGHRACRTADSAFRGLCSLDWEVSERSNESPARLIQVIETPEVKYARTRDGAYVAYEIFGSGPIDLVLSKTLFPVDLMWDLPQLADFLSASAGSPG